MLKLLNIFSVPLVLIIFLFGCEKDCASPKGIYGDWIWTKTYDNHYGITATPEDLGYTEKLSIDDFTFKRYIDDSLVFESQYDLLIRTDSLNNDSHFIIFSSGYEQGIYVDESHLILVETLFLFNPSAHYTRN